MKNQNKCTMTKIKSSDKINLIFQFFVHPDPDRHKEIQQCIAQNIQNDHIDAIHMLNERIYTKNEIGCESPKIIQHHFRHRLMYKDIFDFVENSDIKGYIIFANSDIYLVIALISD